MNELYLIDTDIIIDFLKGVSKAISFVKHLTENTLISVITVAELYAGVKNLNEQQQLDNFLTLFRIVHITPEIAKHGGLLKQQYTKSHGVGLADALIAATAETHQAQLKTLNIKHYPMFKTLEAPYQK